VGLNVRSGMKSFQMRVLCGFKEKDGGVVHSSR
jgi:hypothetical protein